MFNKFEDDAYNKRLQTVNQYGNTNIAPNNNVAIGANNRRLSENGGVLGQYAGGNSIYNNQAMYGNNGWNGVGTMLGMYLNQAMGRQNDGKYNGFDVKAEKGLSDKESYAKYGAINQPAQSATVNEGTSEKPEGDNSDMTNAIINAFGLGAGNTATDNYNNAYIAPPMQNVIRTPNESGPQIYNNGGIKSPQGEYDFLNFRRRYYGK